LLCVQLKTDMPMYQLPRTVILPLHYTSLYFSPVIILSVHANFSGNKRRIPVTGNNENLQLYIYKTKPEPFKEMTGEEC
jgi:hypothetical protein